MPFFPNSSGVEVLGSTLVDNSSNVYINVQTERTERDDISALLKFVAPEAIQDDKEREDAPRCKEDTRQEVLTDILQWLRRPYGGEDPTDILWLTGFMGTGKTAIAQTLAEACAEEKTLAAVFFFSYRLQKSNNHSRLIPTLAYQLTLKIPRAKRFIIDAVSRDPLHPRKNLRSQMESLILQPLEQARQEKPGEKWPNTIIIDGLDECEDEVQQAAVLKLIHECLETGRFPFRVVIASRREKEIREYFEGKGRQRTRQIDLGSYDANPDIELFLRQSFADKHAKDESGSPWPSNEDIDALVRMSSGQFVFASMVLKYVNDPTSYHSESHLQEVLALSSKRNGSSESLAPFTPLDELYASILNKSPSPSESALAIVIISKLSSLHWRPVFASEANRLLESRSNECKRLFDRLHSILFVPLPDQVSTSSYRVYHKSLVDFLTDRRPFRREIQKNLYVPDVVVHTAICKRYLNMYAPTTPNPSLPSVRFARHLASADLKDEELRTLLKSADVTQWAHLLAGGNVLQWQDGNSDTDFLAELSETYYSVHHRGIGCNPLKCHQICRRWRGGIILNFASPDRIKYMVPLMNFKYDLLTLLVRNAKSRLFDIVLPGIGAVSSRTDNMHSRPPSFVSSESPTTPLAGFDFNRPIHVYRRSSRLAIDISPALSLCVTQLQVPATGL